MAFISILIIVFSSFLFARSTLASGKHPVPTYFQRVDHKGTVIDRRSATFGSDIGKPIIEGINLLPVDLIVQPSVVENSGIIQLSWKTKYSNPKDWIGFYCHPNTKHETFLDYFFVTQADSWQDGRGVIILQVFNMRKDCEFRYFRAEQGSSLLAGRSNHLKFTSGNEAPLQGHLALTGKPSEMRVMWTSGSEFPPLVIYGKTSQQLVMNSTGNSSSYSANDMCGAPANGVTFTHPGNIHNVLLTGLLPNTVYFYRYGDGKIMSKIYNFTTALVAGDTTPFEFIIYGDMGLTGPPGAVTTMQHMLHEINDRKTKFIVHSGDLSYGCGMGYIWEQWHALIEPSATLVPYMVGIGNHEQDHNEGGERDPSGAPGEGFHPLWGNFDDNDSGGECGVPSFYRFKMPENGNAPWWYSFDYGMVHFVMMGTEHDFLPGSRQYQWIENDLKSVDRKKTPWIVFAGHRAMYCSDKLMGNFVVSTYLRKALEGLLLKYKVNLALWSHYHAYERTCPVRHGKCVQEGGITHITIGTAGMFLDSDLWIPRDWSLVRDIAFGYGRLTVANSTALHFEFIHNQDRSVRDDLWIYR